MAKIYQKFNQAWPKIYQILTQL